MKVKTLCQLLEGPEGSFKTNSKETEDLSQASNRFVTIYATRPFQPTYSPELNLIERLWKVFKKNVLYNKFYSTYDDFKSACMEFFINQEEHHNEIASVMGEGLEALI